MNKLIVTQDTDFNNYNRNRSSMKLVTAQRMIRKLLSTDRLEKIEIRKHRYTENELAEKLSIDIEKLNLYTGKPTTTNRMAGLDVDLKLIKLYFNTKFVCDNI